MKDDPTPLEMELVQLHPRRPSADCEQRLRQGLNAASRATTAGGDAGSRSRFGVLRGWCAAALGAAALVLLAVLLVERGRNKAVRTAAGPTRVVFRPAAAETEGDRAAVVATGTVLYGIADGGTTVAGTGVPVRQVRLFLLEQARWETAGARASFEIVRPREEVVYVPLPLL